MIQELPTEEVKNTCKNCAWSSVDEERNIYCTNTNSDQCFEFVDEDFVCGKWETMRLWSKCKK